MTKMPTPEYERLVRIAKFSKEAMLILKSANHQHYAQDALYYLLLAFGIEKYDLDVEIDDVMDKYR